MGLLTGPGAAIGAVGGAVGGAVTGPVEAGGVSRAPLPLLARLFESTGDACACLDPDLLVGIADLASLLDFRTGPPPCSPLVA
jgi:hypothetical protein